MAKRDLNEEAMKTNLDVEVEDKLQGVVPPTYVQAVKDHKENTEHKEEVEDERKEATDKALDNEERIERNDGSKQMHLEESLFEDVDDEDDEERGEDNDLYELIDVELFGGANYKKNGSKLGLDTNTYPDRDNAVINSKGREKLGLTDTQDAIGIRATGETSEAREAYLKRVRDIVDKLKTLYGERVQYKVLGDNKYGVIVYDAETATDDSYESRLKMDSLTAPELKKIKNKIKRFDWKYIEDEDDFRYAVKHAGKKGDFTDEEVEYVMAHKEKFYPRENLGESKKALKEESEEKIVFTQNTDDYYDYFVEDDINDIVENIGAVIDGGRNFKDFGDETLLKVVKGNYYDEDEGYDYDTLEELKKVSGGVDFSDYNIQGYSQGDWARVYAPEKTRDDDIQEIEDLFFGKYEVYDNDEYGFIRVPHDITWKGTQDIKKYIANIIGVNAEDILIKKFKGWKKTPEYVDEGKKSPKGKKELTEGYITSGQIARFLEESIDTLLNSDYTISRMKLGNGLMLAVGWSAGWGKEIRDDVIQDKANPDYAICAGIFMEDNTETDLDYLVMPYYENGEVYDTNSGISPKDSRDNYRGYADFLLREYKELSSLNIDKDGVIIEKEDDDIDESCKRQKKGLKEDASKKHNLTLGNQKVDTWFDYYIKVDHTDENTVKEIYGSREELKDESNYYADLLDNGNKIAELELANFEGVGDFSVFGIRNITSDDLVKALETLGYETELDIEAEFGKTLGKLQYGKTADEVFMPFVKEIERVMNRKDGGVDEGCKRQKKELKESFYEGSRVVDDLVDRARGWIDDGEDIDDAVSHAIDDGLIYTEDIINLGDYYGVIDTSELIDRFYDDLYGDIYAKIEDYKPTPNLPGQIAINFEDLDVRIDDWDDKDEVDDAIGDYLSDEYDFAVNGFDYDITYNEDGTIKEVVVGNIDWDLDEGCKTNKSKKSLKEEEEFVADDAFDFTDEEIERLKDISECDKADAVVESVQEQPEEITEGNSIESDSEFNAYDDEF